MCIQTSILTSILAVLLNLYELCKHCTPCIPYFYYLIVFPFFFYWSLQTWRLEIVNNRVRSTAGWGSTDAFFFFFQTDTSPTSPFICLHLLQRVSQERLVVPHLDSPPLGLEMALSKHIFFSRSHNTLRHIDKTLCFTTITLQTIRINEGNSSIMIFLHLFIYLFYCVAFRNI